MFGDQSGPGSRWEKRKNALGSTPSTRSATETRGIIKSDDWYGGLNSFEWNNRRTKDSDSSRFWNHKKTATCRTAQDQCTTYYNSLKLAFAEGHCNSARCASAGGHPGWKIVLIGSGDPTAAGLKNSNSKEFVANVLSVADGWLYDIFSDQDIG